MNIHMMGIGGIGMSAIAQLLLSRGEKVSGCDTKLNPLTEKLKSMGATIFEGHSPEHIDNSIDLVIHSSAIKNDHPELINAKKKNITIFRRGQALVDIIKTKKVIAVTGTHGKTTTSFMITHIMNYAGLNPGFAIGGEIEKLGGNARWEDSDYFVIEADESDGTHVFLKPYISAITNIDNDHMEFYSSLSHISRVMEEFIDNIPRDGLFIGCGEDPFVWRLLKKTKVKTLSYGFSPESDIYATDIKLNAKGSEFNLWNRDSMLGKIDLNIPGKHNVLNSLASVGVCMEIGIPLNMISFALAMYPGVKRRLDVVFRNDGVTVMDDYAHHPNEIRAVIDAVRAMLKQSGTENGFVNRRLIGIFQPHRFTRTKHLANEFGKCFAGLDKLILTDIYSAGDPPIKGVTGRLIYDEVVKFGNPDAIYIESKDDILPYLLPKVQKGDMVLFMGAGDITELAHMITITKLQIPINQT